VPVFDRSLLPGQAVLFLGRLLNYPGIVLGIVFSTWFLPRISLGKG
jgi:hypothetical protein